MEYYIFVTNDCNLNCKYCSILLNKENSKMPKEPVYSITELNKFIALNQERLSDNNADIIFFGGEPTLNYNLIKEIISSQKSIQNKPYKLHYMLHTNGILLKNIPDYVLHNLDSIMLSINYDNVPHSNLNNGYFKQIIDSVHHIKKMKRIPIVARLTITEQTSLYSEIALFNPFFDAVYWQIENNYSFQNFNKLYSNYKFELELVFNIWLSYLKRGILLRFIPFIAATYFNSAQQSSSDSFCCGYNKSMIYIQTNGQCYTCAEDMTTNNNLIGTIETGFKFDEFSLQDIRCKACEYLNMCKGRCGRMHKEFSTEHITEYCKLNSILFNMIKIHYKEILIACKENNIEINLEDPIYHFTEYTP